MSTPSPSPTPKRLKELPVTEGSCLLRSYALQPIKRKDGQVVVLYYSQDPERGKGGADGPDICGEEVALLESLLYRKGNPITINEDYAHTSQKLYSTIWIMHRIGCDIEKAKEFINAVVGDQSSAKDVLDAVGGDQSSAKDVLRADSLDIFGNFITGVSLRAYSSPDSFTIFVSLPYLGTAKRDATPNESRTLRQYRLRQSANSPVAQAPAPNAGRPAIMVHQTWLLSFNDEQIGIFRSKDDPDSDLAPLFPHQKRLTASQALVHIISNLLTSSEKKALDNFRSKISDLEQKLEDNTLNNRGELLNSYSDYIKDVSTMIRIVRSQIGYLDDLRHIFENSYDSKILPEKPRPHRNSYPIPLLSKQAEQIVDVVTGIAAVVAERERFHKELRVMSKDLQLTRTLWLEGDQTQSQSALVGTMTAHVQSQKLIEGALTESFKSQKNIEKTLKSQGQTISVFTLITTVFLLLGLFSSYFAVPDDHKGVKFWIAAGPATAILTLSLCYFLYVPDDTIKEFLGGWWKRLEPWLQLLKCPWVGGGSQSQSLPQTSPRLGESC